MEENRPEYAEAIQVGKRRSSLGALNKSKPVTKLKSMFEAKGSAPKFKDSGLLSKLKPISASRDANSLAAALLGSMGPPASVKMPAHGPSEQPPATPTEPLFTVLPAPAEPEAIPNPSPPRSVDDMRMSVPGYESVHDGSEADARSAKSPSSGGFLKRMSSSLKKALTPKSSSGKQKAGGFSPSYAGSEASNLSPRPSGQLLLTPASQPSATSLDLNCRSDQLQPAPPRSPSALMGYEVRSARDEQDWVRSYDGSAENGARPIFSSARPPRSPNMMLPASSAQLGGPNAQHEACLLNTSRDVVPRLPPAASPDQSQTLRDVLITGTPMVAEDSFMSGDSEIIASAVAPHGVVTHDSFAESLTASPTVPEGSEGSRGSPPPREVNMGAAIFCPLPPSSTPDRGADAITQVDDLVFPSLPSADLPEAMALVLDTTVSASAPQAAVNASADVDMATCDVTPAPEELRTAAIYNQQVIAAAVDTRAAASSMEVDASTPQEPVFLQPALPVSSRSLGAPLNLDLTAATNNSPGSPDTATPTGAGSGVVDNYIIGLTPVRPDTAAKSAMHVDTPTMSTVAEGSPEALPAAPSTELQGMDLEGDFNQANAQHALPRCTNRAREEQPAPYEQGDAVPPCDGDSLPVALDENRASESPVPRPPVHVVTSVNPDTAAAPTLTDVDMDRDDSADKDPCEDNDALQQDGPGADPVNAQAVTPAPVGAAPGVAYEELELVAAGFPAPAPTELGTAETECGCTADAEASASTSHEHSEPIQQQAGADDAASLEVADQEPVLPSDDRLCYALAAMTDGLAEERVQPVQSDGLVVDGEQAAQSMHADAEVMEANEEIPVSIYAATADVCNVSNDNSFCLSKASSPTDAPEDCTVTRQLVDGIDTPGLLSEASNAATSFEVEPSAVGSMEPAPRFVTGEEGEQVTVIAETAVPPEVHPELLVAAAPPAEAAVHQHIIIAEQVAEPGGVSDPLPKELDIDMEDAEGTSSDHSYTAGQLPGAMPTHVDMVQLPGSPRVHTGSMGASPATASSPDIRELHGDIPSDAASDDSPEIISPQGKAQEETLVQASHSVESVEAGHLGHESWRASEEAMPCTIPSSEQLGLPTTDAPEELQLQSVGADLSAPPCSTGARFDEGSLGMEGEKESDGAASLAPAAIEAEGADAIVDGQPLAVPQMACMRPVAAVDALPDAPGEDNQQPMEADTDLMEVDSSAAAAHLSVANADGMGICVGGATEAAVATDSGPDPEPTSAESPLVKPASQQQPMDSGADDQMQHAHMVPGVGYTVAAEALAELLRAQHDSMGLSMDQDLVAIGSTVTDLSILDGSIARISAPRTDALQVLGALPGAESVPASSVQVAGPRAEAADCIAAPPAIQTDDPMMVSPMPQRPSMLRPALRLAQEQVVPQASPTVAAQDATQGEDMPGTPAPVSPGHAVRAFQLDDILDSEACMEPQTVTEVVRQEQVLSHSDQGPAGLPDSIPSLSQTVSPVVDGMTAAAAALATTTALEFKHDTWIASTGLDGSASKEAAGIGCPITPMPVAADDAPAANTPAPDVPASRPSVSTPPALAMGVDVPMADSLEAIEALWGNDDLLAEPGAAASTPVPQVASSPVSATMQTESPVLPQGGRKVAPGVVLQVQRESLDLFSLRNSCAARVSDSLMVESLDTFEGLGSCAKSRAVGFIPMAPVKEGDEEVALVGRASGSEGGSEPSSAGPQSPNLSFAVDTTGSPVPTPGLDAAGVAAATGTDTPSANKPATCSLGTRGGAQAPAAVSGQVKGLPSGLKAATPGGAVRANSTPSTALKAMAAANAAGAGTAKTGMPKRPPPAAAGGGQARALLTPGQPVAGLSMPLSGSRHPGAAATPGTGTARVPTPTSGAKPPMPTTTTGATGATPGAVPGRPSVTPRSAGVFTAGKGHPSASGVNRPGPYAQQPMQTGQSSAGTGLFDTPLILRAAAIPFADTPFSGCEFDLDTVDISAEASKAIAMLGGGDASKAAAGTICAATHHATPAMVAARGVVGGTPTMSVLETHVQLLTNKLADAEASIHQLQDENAMLRDQLSTLQFESSMTNDLDMEREARQFLEQELAVVRHRSDGLEADLRTAHAEVKRREQAAADLLVAQQAKEAEWARQKAEVELQVQQMASELEEARSFAQQAGTRIAEAEARSAAATTKCDEETTRSRDLQVTLGLQAHQLVQVQRARDDAEAKFQRAMEQLIAAQTSHKKAVVEYEQKILQSNNLVSQINDVRDKYRQMKNHAANCEQRAQHAEARAQETVAALAAANMEKAELMQMCNELLTQLEATKVKGGR